MQRPHASTPSQAASQLQAFNSALAAGLWSVVEDYINTSKVHLENNAPIYRALVHYEEPTAIAFFKKLFLQDLRRQQVSDQKGKQEIEARFRNLLDEAIRRDNKSIVRIFLGEDSDFNKTAQGLVSDPQRFRRGSIFNNIAHSTTGIPFLRNNTTKSPKDAKDFPREMEAISIAASYDSLEMIDLVVSRLRSFRVDLAPFMTEAMKQASTYGHTGIVTSLLNRGCPPESMTSALMAAVAAQQIEVIALLKDKVSPDERLRAVITAGSQGQFQLAKQIAPPSTNLCDLWNDSLKAMARSGDLARVQELLELGAEPSTANCEALREAVKLGHIPVAEVLIKAGANPASIPVEVLVKLDCNKHGEFIQMILDKMLEGDINISSFIKGASTRGAADLLCRWIENNVDTKTYGDKLMVAALDAGEHSIVKALLEGGYNLRGYADYLFRQSGDENTASLAAKIAIILIAAFDSTPGPSKPPDKMIERLRKLDPRVVLNDIQEAWEESRSNGSQPRDLSSFLCRTQIKQILRWINPAFNSDALKDKLSEEMKHFESKLANPTARLNEVGVVYSQCWGIQEMIFEMVDGLVLGTLQENAKESAKAWTEIQIQDKRSTALALVADHLLSNFTLSEISRFFHEWLRPVNCLDEEARPHLGSRLTPWTLLMDKPFETKGGFIVKCIEDTKELKDVGMILNNCIKDDGWRRFLSWGVSSVLTFSRPGEDPVAALELTRNLEADSVILHGVKWGARQFEGRSRSVPSAELQQAKGEFLDALKNGTITTNNVPNTMGGSKWQLENRIEFITGIPINGSAALIRKYYLAFTANGKELIPRNSTLYEQLR